MMNDGKMGDMEMDDTISESIIERLMGLLDHGLRAQYYTNRNLLYNLHYLAIGDRDFEFCVYTLRGEVKCSCLYQHCSDYRNRIDQGVFNLADPNFLDDIESLFSFSFSASSLNWFR